MRVSAATVGKWLKSLGYSLHVNRKALSHTQPPGRDDQFARIAALRQQCLEQNIPLISVDTKICSAEHILVWTKPLRGTGGSAVGRFPTVARSVG